MKRKVFVDGHVFDIASQGSATYLKNILDQLCEESDVQLYVGCRQLPELLLGREGIVHVPYRSKSSLVRLLLEIPFLVYKISPDCCWFQYIVPPFLFGVKKLVTIHDVLPLDFKKYFGKGFYFKVKVLFSMSAYISDVVFTVSHYSKARIACHFSTREEKIVVTPNGVAEDFFDTSSQQEKEKFILYVSRVEPRKRQLELVEAFEKSKFLKNNYRLVLVGADYSGGSLQKFYGKEFLEYKGVVSEDELRALVKSAAGFVYPSAAEGFGIPPLEAAASNCVVLCSNETAMADFDFFSPHHVDMSSPEKLLVALDTFFEDVGHGEVGRVDAIRNEIKQKYSWRSSAEKVLKCLRS